MNRRAGGTGLGAWLLVVVLVTIALQRAGHGLLAAPPLTSTAGWSEWLATREPLVAAVALVRLLALGAAWYLLGASVVGLLLRIFRADRLVSVVDRVTVPAVRRLLVATAGVTLMSGVGPPLALARGPTAGIAVASAAQPATTGTDPPTASTAPTLTMHLLGPSEGAGSAAPAVPAPTPPARASPSPPVPAAIGATWTVQPGECLWTIAEEVLVRAWGRLVTDAEIVPYWRVLIEANRDRLADRSNEHLIFPGQVFSVPPPPTGGSR